MSLPAHIDADILRDFLTEAAELIEQVDQDLVHLEQTPDDLELLNRIFRALHTIKGSSSFLSLDPLTHFAHAAEDALNALRKGEVPVSAEVMDLLLRAVDVVRSQMAELGNDAMPSEGPADLAEALRKVGAGQAPAGAPAAAAAPVAAAVAAAAPAAAPADDEPRLKLDESKSQIFPFMVEDLNQSVAQLAELVEQMAGGGDLMTLAVRASDLTEELERSARFFEIDALVREIGAVHAVLHNAGATPPPLWAQAAPRLRAAVDVLKRRGSALVDQKLIALPTQTLVARLRAIADGAALEAAALLPAGADIAAALALDGVEEAKPQAGSATTPVTGEAPAASAAAAATGTATAETKAPQGSPAVSAEAAERTIRVDVGRLEELLNLVGELVLQKNRVVGIAKRLANCEALDATTNEELTQIGGDLHRVTSDLQAGVMKTRMQPLNKLFSRYPRVIRDLARMAGKQIELVISGGDTEVDKSVIEFLGDPLVHILRNSADHGVETTEQRVAAGKEPQGHVYLAARQQGNHVVVEIRDDGRGLDADKIGRKAVEKGLLTPEQLAAMSKPDVWKLIFAPGLSTADKVSDISGRGVGMDVVRTNITRLNGIVDVHSEVGVGTTVSIRIPLTVAIMPSMVVQVRGVQYAAPLLNITEIVRPGEHVTTSVGGQRVIRLRDSVIPLVDLGATFGQGMGEKEPAIALIVGLGEQRMGVLVDRLIGQQEVVIKPLDETFSRAKAVSGATVREDGGVSLILDVAQLFRMNESRSRAA